MADRASIAAVVSGSPFRIELRIPLPDRTEVDTFRRQAGDPLLSGNQQALAQQKLRVAEVLWEKDNQRLLAVRAAIPLICDQQKRFLVSGERRALAHVSLADIARETGFRAHVLAAALKDYGVKCPVGVLPVDELVGPVGDGRLAALAVDLDPEALIATEDEVDLAAYEGFVGIFREGRQHILDPVLVIPEPSTPARAYVVQGHHRTAAAFSVGARIRSVVLRGHADLAYVRDGRIADLAEASRTFDEFVMRVRRHTELLDMPKGGWAGWLRAVGVAPRRDAQPRKSS